jgi:hypothetical protein
MPVSGILGYIIWWCTSNCNSLFKFFWWFFLKLSLNGGRKMAYKMSSTTI